MKAAGLTTMLAEVALVRPLLLKLRLMVLATLWERLAKVATPLTAVAVKRALQGAAAGAARDSDHGGVVAAAQVAVLIFNPDLRLLRKGDTGDGAARRLGLDDQLAGGAAGHGQ